MTAEINQHQILLEALQNPCRDGCTVARLAISNICKGGYEINDDAAEVLGECLDGPFLAGTCGTEKKVCSHPKADSTMVFNEQVELLQSSIL